MNGEPDTAENEAGVCYFWWEKAARPLPSYRISKHMC